MIVTNLRRDTVRQVFGQTREGKVQTGNLSGGDRKETVQPLAPASSGDYLESRKRSGKSKFPVSRGMSHLGLKRVASRPDNSSVRTLTKKWT
jgi:hypothetical protein